MDEAGMAACTVSRAWANTAERAVPDASVYVTVPGKLLVFNEQLMNA